MLVRPSPPSPPLSGPFPTGEGRLAPILHLLVNDFAAAVGFTCRHLAEQCHPGDVPSRV
jgi:hypothetical protein